MGCSPPICLHEGFENVYNNYLFETVLVDGTMFFSDVLQSKPTRRKKKAGGLGGGGGGRSPPPICKHNIFITGSERVHMASVFAGRMILEVFLHSLKKRTGWGGRSFPPFASRLPA